MSDITHVLCNKCHVTPQRGFERNGETWAACAICGQEDRVEEILGEAAEYHIRKGIDGVFSGLQGGALTIKSPPQRQYRWITGD
jgi:hypothetical protein